MPGKLVYFIIVMLMLVLFMGFNLSNRCDISVIFYVFKDVPIFLSMLFAFLLGNIAVLPFLISSRHKMKKAEKQAALYHDVEKVELKPEKRRWFGKRSIPKRTGRQSRMRSCCLGFRKPYLFFIIISGVMMMINAGTGAFAESSEPALQPAVQTLAQKAFAQKTDAAVRQFFEKNLATLPNAQAQVQALTLLAEYEQHNGNYSNAADCYRQAAGFDTTDKKLRFLLDAVRVLLCGGSMDSARSLLSEIAAALPVSDEDPYYRRAAVYDTWRLLAEDRADRAVPLITAYTKKKAFSEYHPALLFTLWWVNGDEDAKQRLLKEYPAGMEAAAVNGTVTVQPSTFWYLMPRSGLAQKPAAGSTASKTGTSSEAIKASPQSSAASKTEAASAQPSKPAAGSETQAKPSYYQLGFYKTKKYAEALATDLQKKHFTPIIKEEMRPSGTVYFAVLVKENAAGDMGLRLKDAGYEAFPIFP